jgi:REP element-mobilizing transposase RayT
MSSLHNIRIGKVNKTEYYIPLYKNSIYHIYNRGNGKEKIFYEEKNYLYFLKQYDKYISELADTFAFCLLPNHFHLLIRIKCNDPNTISEAFRKLFISYSMSINRQEQRKGSLFQRGFKRKVIEDSKYFYSAIYYIHANPLHHKMVKDLTEYKFSSFSLLSGEKETRLCRDEVIEWFGGKENFITYHLDIQNKIIDDNFIIETDI